MPFTFNDALLEVPPGLISIQIGYYHRPVIILTLSISLVPVDHSPLLSSFPLLQLYPGKMYHVCVTSGEDPENPASNKTKPKKKEKKRNRRNNIPAAGIASHYILAKFAHPARVLLCRSAQTGECGEYPIQFFPPESSSLLSPRPTSSTNASPRARERCRPHRVPGNTFGTQVGQVRSTLGLFTGIFSTDLADSHSVAGISTIYYAATG